VLLDVLRLPEIQLVAVCDVNRGSSDYLDWGPDELRNKVRMVLQDSTWGATLPGPTAGREVAQGIVNEFYAKQAGKTSYNGCAAYEDFRELLAKEKDLDAVIVSTPDLGMRRLQSPPCEREGMSIARSRWRIACGSVARWFV